MVLTREDLDLLRQLKAAGVRGRAVRHVDIRVTLNRLAKGGDAMAQFVSKGHDFFACLSGTARIDNDRGMIDKLWSKQAEAWFPGGKADPNLALLRFDIECDLGFAQLELSLASDGWVKAELFHNTRVVFRAWIEDPYEEKEGWPDGAAGVGEAPLRISKRGGWLDVDAAAFPGVPVGKHGRFQIQDATG